jgi:peptidoglycan/LPS O-acetylase OafA/YrhL
MGRAAPIQPLTSLRFFAAISVVFYHTYAAFLPSKPFPEAIDRAIGVGFLGVSFFFVLSGFILAINYLDRPGDAGNPLRTAPWSFYVARFARIYPLYLLGLLIHAPFVAAHRFSDDPSPVVALGKLLISFGVNAGLLQAWVLRLAGGWNFPGWSLSVEAFFYALFPFVLPVLWRSRRRDRTLLLALYASALIVPSVVALLEHAGSLRPEQTVGLEMFPLLRLPEFLFGAVLARRYSRPREGWLLRSPTALWIGGVLLLSAVVADGTRIPNLILQCGVLMPAFALIVLGFARGNSRLHRLLSRKPFVLLGEASYGIYVLHIPIFYWFCYVVQDGMGLAGTPVHFAVDRPIHYSIYLVALIAISMLSVRYFEQPLRHWIRRF